MVDAGDAGLRLKSCGSLKRPSMTEMVFPPLPAVMAWPQICYIVGVD